MKGRILIHFINNLESAINIVKIIKVLNGKDDDDKDVVFVIRISNNKLANIREESRMKGNKGRLNDYSGGPDYISIGGLMILGVLLQPKDGKFWL